MKIVRKNQVNSKNYKDIPIGEVFISNVDDCVYMKTEYGALNLEDGYYYNVEDCYKIELLDVELHIL